MFGPKFQGQLGWVPPKLNWLGLPLSFLFLEEVATYGGIT